MSVFEYVESIITQRRSGDSNDPYIPLSKNIMIKNGLVQLPEIPSKFHRVAVTGEDNQWFEIDDGVPTANQYKVSYLHGYVEFDPSNDGKTLLFDFMGTGNTFISAERIWVQYDGRDVTQTLGDITAAASQFYFTGEYDNDRLYHQFNIVTYQGGTYIAIKDTKGNVPTDLRYWRKISGFQWRGIYSEDEVYGAGDSVSSPDLQTVYFSLVDDNNFPLDDATKWTIIVDISGVTNEVTSGEAERVAAENQRKQNEDIRIANEDERESAEQDRIAAEDIRKSNEEIREENENERIAAEENRVTSEDERVANEQQRIDNENQRMLQEIERQSATNQAITNIEDTIDSWAHKGTYDSATQYEVNNVVVYQGSSYVCIQDTVGNAPTNTFYWRLLARKGADGVGLNYRGEFSMDEYYEADDLVTYEGSIYHCFQASHGILPTDKNYWTVFVVSGGGGGTFSTYENRVIINSDSANVQIGIDNYNANKDWLMVYQNSTRIIKDKEYSVNPDGASIDCLNGTWDAGTIFDFNVIKNVSSGGEVEYDGNNIMDGTVGEEKLTGDLQNKLLKIDTNERSINVLKDSVSGLEQDIEMVQDDLSQINTEMGKVQNEIVQIQSSVAQQQNDLTEHFDDIIYKKEVHGLRIQDGVPEYYNSDTGEWVPFKGGGGVPVGNVSGFTAKAGNGQVTLTWSDPADLVVDGVTIAKWAATKILRKIGSYPQNENDGILVVNNGVRDQYKTNGFIDTGLTNNTTYYYMAFPYTEQDAVTVDNANRVNVTPRAPKIYGVRIDKANSNPETAVTRMDDAIGMSVADFDTVYPYNEIKPCMLKNGVVQYYLNPNDFTKKADGSAADITSGNDGDVMIEFPKMWWKITSNANYVDVKLANTAVDSSFKPLGHTKGSTVKDKVYIGAYLGFESASKLRSLSGKTPLSNKTIREFRTSAQANGAGYQQIGYFQLLMLQVLYLVKYKNLDSQTALGRGYVDENTGVANTGGTNSKGMYYGETTGKQQMKFAGIEDLWGNFQFFVEGLRTDAEFNILIGTENFNDAGNGYENYGKGSTSVISGYMTDIQGSTAIGFIIKVGEGSATTYYCDSCVLQADRISVFGGSYSSSSIPGAFRTLVNYDTNSTATIIGARLCYL